MLAKLEAGFNAGDPKVIEAIATDDVHLISPVGIDGQGRANAVQVVRGDLNTVLNGARSKLSIDSTRQIGSDALWIDATHEVTGAHAPDGKELPPMKFHVIFLMVKKGGNWRIAEARPYAFLHQ